MCIKVKFTFSCDDESVNKDYKMKEVIGSTSLY